MTSTTAKVIADTVHPQVPQARITTFEVYAPRFLLAEINTHRVLARSAASSRAIPVAKRVEMVAEDPFVPLAFGRNQPGMVADENLDDETNEEAKQIWLRGVVFALMVAKDLNDIGAHKQLANRVLEPYSYVHGVITATEWQNFWDLRLAANAQPEFQELAEKMYDALVASEPVKRHDHLPYTDDITDNEDEIHDLTLEQLQKVSAARCARISYTYHDGKPFDLQRDIDRCQLLIDDKHMSPFDHVATADTFRYADWEDPEYKWNNPEDHRQFWGFIPYRVKIEKETGYVGRRSSFRSFTL